MNQARPVRRNGQLAADQPALVEQRFAASTAVPEAFFEAENERIARLCLEMARRFHAGGRLIAFGNGAWGTDAQHVSVEFVHPVIVGKRALPALALTNDAGLMGARFYGETGGMPFSRQINLLARQADIALGFTFSGDDGNVLEALEAAGKLGLLTIGLTGGHGSDSALSDLADLEVDFCFSVPSDDPFVVQETHETLYHILWELVHVYFEHEGLLE